jgi:glyoxylase-like metal-dependent hydrolase (beta-lactamase superfamily II)
VPAIGRPRSTQDGCASVEASLAEAPQDEDRLAKNKDQAMTKPGSQHHVRIGAIDIWILADGILELPLALFPDAARPGADASFGPGPFRTAINCFAIRTGGRLFVVDAGCGPWRGEQCGQLLPALRAAGLDPDAIEAILMTHLHGDHAGGLISKTGAAFPKAALMLSEAEAAFWGDPGLPVRIPERMKATLATATKALATYEGRITRFRPGDEVVPGVTAVALPGHTPGQTGFRIESGGEQLFIWADIVHVAAVQFPHPDWTIAFDTNGEQAAETRQRVFAQCATEGTLIAGMHLDFPAIGRVTDGAGGYAFEAERA